MWSRKRRELYFREGDSFMAAGDRIHVVLGWVEELRRALRQ
jgi:hypothetical protein